MQLCSVVGSSMTCIQLLAGGFDDTATTAVGLLLGQFELLFLTVQLCFSVGLIAFLATILTRVWVLYCAESERSLANAITALLGCVSLLMIRILTRPIAGANVGRSLLRYARLVWRDVLFQPAAAVGLCFVALAVRYSDTRKVREDRGFKYGFKGLFHRSKAPEPEE
ncbi:hypothetical protein JKP88DRAFT_72109 [Tribonema minus]|uniref:Uncharacterized protein n=1 Tax=Tribonema minus TaxID=303371 RepID=A0A835YS82_9STRA|nr:hypothetical protein JKP88DRAFT_72109 [Tribonema minus]